MSAGEPVGPAFPTSPSIFGPGGAISVGDDGMSLRDYFAAKAMQGMLAGDCFDFESLDFEASFSYKIADAMLKARNA